MKVTIDLDPELLAAIRRLRKESGETRAGWIGATLAHAAAEGGEYPRGCPVHGNEQHGREAEELRRAIEEFVERGADVAPNALQRMLDEVDARDSLAFVELVDRRAAKVLEAFADQVERSQPPAVVASEIRRKARELAW